MSPPITPTRLPLHRWFAAAQAAAVAPVANVGFSGAGLWQVAHADRLYALRRWPASAGSPSRLGEIHQFQAYLSAKGLPVPRLAPSLAGPTVCDWDGALWELAEWVPGAADYWEDPQPAKLRAALQCLAQVHLAAADFVSADGRGGCRPGTSQAMARRAARTSALLAGELDRLGQAVSRAPADERPLAADVHALVARALPEWAQRLAAWAAVPLLLQWRLGDPWHDHVLFTDDRVTGVIDFGAAGIDSPATDVARLLGSLVGDDAALRSEGLAAYEGVRPLSEVEREAVHVVDGAGTVLAAANWLHWLHAEPSSADAATFDRSRALARLRRLHARLGYNAAGRPQPHPR